MSHRSTRLILLACALAAPLLVLIAPVHAGILFQDSFESPSTGSDGGAIQTLSTKDTAWTKLTTGGTLNGLLDPENVLYYSGTTGETPNPIPNMDGVQVAFVFGGGGATAETFSHTLTDNLVLGTEYDLGISVGERKSDRPSLGYTLQLWAGGIELASISDATGPALTEDAFTRVTISHTAVATDPIGQPLEIRFGTTQGGNIDGPATDFDAVELVTPEPASASLLAAACCALLARRGRKTRCG